MVESNKTTVSEEIRLLVAKELMSGLVAFIKNGGGSYRHLIYDYLKFSQKAYSELFEAGGMWLTNWIFEVLHDEKHKQEYGDYYQMTIFDYLTD